MRYDTGNPVGTDGSSDPRDLYDNAGIIDLLLSGPLGEYMNRVGFPLRSWRGIMQQVTDYLIEQGYESVYLIYGAGVIVQRQTQLVQRDGELYRVMNATDIPLTLTGSWVTDAPKLQAVGDAALRQQLASSAGISMISGGDFSTAVVKTDLFPSSIARPLSDVANSVFRLDQFSGLVKDDQDVDNGPMLNAIISVAAANGIMLDGQGATFYTRTTVRPQSNLVWARIKLKSMGAPDGDSSPKSHIPVIDINGYESLKTGIRSYDIIADGQRSLWPNISMSTAGPEGGGSEDGGMHAWRITGRVEDCDFYRCHGVNAASAGWAVHNPTPSGSVAYFSHIGLRFYDCVGNGNGEHGLFGDSIDGLKWVGGELKGNGMDLNDSDPLEHGSRGRRDTNGKLFGGPFDFESYPPLMGSLFTNVLMRSTDCRGNAVGPLLYNPIPTNLPGYVIPENLRFLDCDFDEGLVSAGSRPDSMVGNAFLAAGAQVTAASFGSLTLASRFSNKVVLNYVGRPDLSGSYINVDSLKAQLNYCGYSELTCGSLTANVGISPAPITTFERAQGASGMLATPSLQSIHAAPNCGLSLNYLVSITGVSGSQPGGLTITPPPGFHVGSIEFSAYVTSTGLPVTSATTVTGNGLTATAFFDSASGGPLTAGVRVVLVPNL